MEQITTTTLQADLGVGAELGLTERQIEAAAWAAEGKTDSEIGMIIGRTARTAKLHVLNAMERTDTHTRAQLVAQLFVNKVLAGKDVVRMGIFSAVLGCTWLAPTVVEASTEDTDSTEQDVARRHPRRNGSKRTSKTGNSGVGGRLDLALNCLSDFIPGADGIYTDADLMHLQIRVVHQQEVSA